MHENMPKCKDSVPKRESKYPDESGYNKRIGLHGLYPGSFGKRDRLQGFLQKIIGKSEETDRLIPNSKTKVTVLTPYMEVIGPFVWLEECDGALLAEIAKHIVVLPLELKDELTPHLGHRITILRTDIQGKEYLVRILADDKQDLPTLEDTSRNPVNLCKIGHLPNRCEVIG